MAKAQVSLFPLSAEELHNRAKEMARLVRSREEVEKRKKDADKEFAAEFKKIDERVQVLAQEIDDEAVEREIQPALPGNGKKKGKKAEESEAESGVEV